MERILVEGGFSMRDRQWAAIELAMPFWYLTVHPLAVTGTTFTALMGELGLGNKRPSRTLNRIMSSAALAPLDRDTTEALAEMFPEALERLSGFRCVGDLVVAECFWEAVERSWPLPKRRRSGDAQNAEAVAKWLRKAFVAAEAAWPNIESADYHVAAVAAQGPEK